MTDPQSSNSGRQTFCRWTRYDVKRLGAFLVETYAK